MKRPFAFLGFSFLLGALTVFFTSELISLVFLFVCAALVFALWRRRSRELLLSFAGYGTAILLTLLVSTLAAAAYGPCAEQTAEVKGEIIQAANPDGTAFEVRVSQVEGAAVRPFSVLLYAGRQLRFEPYDGFSGRLTFFALQDEPGFSPRKSRMAEGMVLAARSAGDIYIQPDHSQKGLVLKIKQCLQDSVDGILSEDAADLLSAMLLGEKDRVDSEMYDAFKLAGVNHILVISGMHMSVIAGCVLLLFRKLRFPRKATLLLSILVILLYMAVTGFGKSVVRSGVMCILLLISGLVGEETDGLNSLGVSVLLICLFNPYAAVDLGFLLSVSATAGIILLASKMQNRLLAPMGDRLKKLLYAPASLLCVSAAAFLFITPVLLFFFGTVNPLSVLVSMLLSAPSTLFLVCGGLLVIIGLASPALAAPLAMAVIFLSKFMVAVVKEFAHLGGMFTGFSRDSSVLVFVGILLVTALCLGGGKNLKRLGAATCVFFLVAAAVLPVHTGVLRVVAEDTGSGFMVSLVKGREAVVLCSQGRNNAWAGYTLKEMGVDTIKVLHLGDTGEAQYAEKLIASFPTQLVLAAPGTIVPYGGENYEREYRFSPFPQVEVEIDLFGKVITVEIYGKKVVLLKDPVLGEGISCDLALVSGESTKVNSQFTIIRTNDIMGLQTPGNYIAGTDETLCASFGVDGSMRIRRLG